MRPFDPRLLRHARSSAWFLASTAVLGLLRTACTIAFCWLLAHGVAAAVAGRSLEWTLAGLALVVAARGVTVWAMDAAAASGAARVKSELRRRVMASIGRLGPQWVARRNRAEVATTAVMGLESLDGYFALFLPQLVLTAVATPLVVATMLLADPLSGIIAVATIPLIPVFMVLIGWATQAAQQRQWSRLLHLSGRFLDAVMGLATLKIFGRATRQESRLAAVTDDYRRATLKVLRFSFLSGFALEIIATLSVALVAVSVGLRLVDGAVGLEVGLFVLLLAPEAFLPLRQVGANYHASADGLSAASDAFAIIDDVPAAAAPRGPLAGGDVVFDRVTVARGDRTVASGLSATAPAGRITAISGPSGSGKSSLVAALLGFADHAGSFTIGGRTVERADIAWCGQRPRLVRGTVRENVALGDDRPDPVLVRRSLALAAADEIDPDTVVDADGRGLSGGQSGRIGIARAIYRCQSRNTPVIVLDEPSAALDADTEARMLDGLRRLAELGVAVIVTSHRDAVLRCADSVVELGEVSDVVV